MFKSMSPICLDHKFVIYERRAIGFWQKRDCPGDGIHVPGVVEMCPSCRMMRLKPDNPVLRVVECERDQVRGRG